jgi:SAM-dependent methyltransferase
MCKLDADIRKLWNHSLCATDSVGSTEMPGSRLEEIVQSLNPASVLDVGCGCGRHLTSLLPRYCPQVFAIDVVSYTSQWRQLMRSHGMGFCRMDATDLAFAGDTFPLVLERDTLHHIARWQDALCEMLRVSSDRVLIEEPVDELRSPEKQRTYEAQGLFLQLQAEVGYPHYWHLNPETLLSFIRSQAQVLEMRFDKSDAPVTFDGFFESYSELASRRFWILVLSECEQCGMFLLVR